MKRILTIVASMAAGLLISALSVMADEGIGVSGSVNESIAKDECLLVAMNCPDRVDTLQQTIDRLHKEIGKGSDVYTTDELRRLNDKLDAATEELNLIENY